MKRAILFTLLIAVACALVLPINFGKALSGLKQVGETIRPISEEEEYFIGRAVAANILSKYPLWKKEAMTAYVNLTGNALARHSRRPEVYSGYHFAILDTDEINALSAPSGIIFVTRGLIQQTESEDELSAVIAHEICHIVAKDPLKAIKSDRMKSLGAFTASEMTSGSSQVVKLFNNTVMDISGTLLEKGYSRKQEKEADLAAIGLMKASGYNPDALLSMLQKLQLRETKKSKAFSAHPPAKNRCEYVSREVGKSGGSPSPARIDRYRVARQLSGI